MSDGDSVCDVGSSGDSCDGVYYGSGIVSEDEATCICGEYRSDSGCYEFSCVSCIAASCEVDSIV